METDCDRKLKDMQKYIPFIENIIRKLKSGDVEKLRKSKLSHIQMLHVALTKKDKKHTLKTLIKYENFFESTL